jgi:hypothetical protein
MEVEAVHTLENTWGHTAVNERFILREALGPGLAKPGLLTTSRNSDNYQTWSVVS